MSLNGVFVSHHPLLYLGSWANYPPALGKHTLEAAYHAHAGASVRYESPIYGLRFNRVRHLLVQERTAGQPGNQVNLYRPLSRMRLDELCIIEVPAPHYADFLGLDYYALRPFSAGNRDWVLFYQNPGEFRFSYGGSNFDLLNSFYFYTPGTPDYYRMEEIDADAI